MTDPVFLILTHHCLYSPAVSGSYVDDMLKEARDAARAVEQRYIKKLKDEKVGAQSATKMW